MTGFRPRGLDHVMILVRDLAGAAQAWARLGFNVSPRGVHSTHLGTANHTIMLQRDYIELIGVISATPTNLVTREFLDRRGDGMDRIAMRTHDAYADAEALRTGGTAVLGPFDFGRSVDRDDGLIGEARFSVFHWPVDQAPGDLRIRACQHHTPNDVWLPSLLHHANTATRITRLEILAANSGEAAAQMARLIGGSVRADGAECHVVSSGEGEAEFLFMSAAALAKQYPLLASPAAPEGVAALAIVVADIDAAARVIGSLGRREADRIIVPRDHANGLTLVLESA